MNYGKNIRATFEFDKLGVSVWLYELLPEGRFVYEGKLTRKKMEAGQSPSNNPTLFLEDDIAQQLYLELDKLFGKKRAVGNSATLEATKYHLEDMRTLALKATTPVSDLVVKSLEATDEQQ